MNYKVPAIVKGVIYVSSTSKNCKLFNLPNYRNKFIDISVPGGSETYSKSITDMCLTTSINCDYTFVEWTSIASAALIIRKNKYTFPKISCKA